MQLHTNVMRHQTLQIDRVSVSIALLRAQISQYPHSRLHSSKFKIDTNLEPYAAISFEAAVGNYEKSQQITASRRRAIRFCRHAKISLEDCRIWMKIFWFLPILSRNSDFPRNPTYFADAIVVVDLLFLLFFYLKFLLFKVDLYWCVNDLV